MSQETLLFFAALALKAVALSALCGGLFWTLRRHEPRARASYLAVVTILFLSMPLLSGLLPRWEPPSFGSLAVAGQTSLDAAAVDTSQELSDDEAAALVVSLPEDGAEEAGSTAGPGGLAPYARTFDVASVPWGLMAFTVWLVGALALLGHFVWALLQLELLRRRSTPARGPVAANVPILVAPLRSAVTFGTLRPVIVLPSQWRRWSRERLDVVLAHELEHVRRFDWTWRLVGEIAACLYWPLPMAWMALRRLRLEQELSCDRAVVSSGLVGPTQYGDHLIDLATARGASAALAATIVHKTTLEERLMKLQESSASSRRWAIVPCVLVLLVAAPLLAALGAEEPLTPELRAALQQLDALHAELEPLEARMHEREKKLHPFMERLEEKSREIEREVAGMHSEEVRETERAIEERARRLEELHRATEKQLHAEHDKMVVSEKQLHSLGNELRELTVVLEKVEREAALGRGDKEVRDRARARVARKQEEIVRVHEKIAAVQQEVRHDPETMAAMERLQAEISELAEAHSARMQERHVDIEPLQREMEQIQEEMADAQVGLEEVHEELSRVHERIEPVVERLRAAQRVEMSKRLGAAFGRTPSAEALDRLDRDIDWQIRDDALRLRGSAATLRELLRDEYPGASGSTVDAFVLELLSLDIEI